MINEIGSTSSAFIPLFFTENYYEDEEREKLGKVIVSGFGIRLSIATESIDISKIKVLRTGKL